jgi:hypothetical protein
MTKIKTALIKSIAYWERMIAFVETLCPIKQPLMSYMIDKIGICWDGKYEALCIMNLSMDCGKCPLLIINEQCGCLSGNLWGDVDESKTWGEWLIYAHEMLMVLKMILRRW